MNFTEDFCKIQGLITSIHANTGNFTDIRYCSGNEAKITKIVEDIQQWLNKKKYFRDGMINYKREMSVRKLVLLFILNTELKNQSLFDSKVSHLIGIIPQFSNFLLTTIIFDLNLYEFYAEAITGLPVEISLELLENCNKYIVNADPYLILKQTSVLAQSIYFKIYHMRYERNDKLDNLSVKLLDKFMGILKNYITPVTEKLLNWPTVKMYQYMGKAIYEILNLLKTCLSTFEEKEFVIPYYQFYQFNSETNHPLVDSPVALNKSVDILKECNKNLISVCEGNVSAVSIDVFCSWVECKQDNLTLQQAIRTLAYDVNQHLKLIEDPGDLPQMLGSIEMNPQPIEEIIKASDENTLLESVIIENENQHKWYKALLSYGIFHSDQIYNVFKSVVHLSDQEDLINLLSLNNEIKLEYDFKNFMIQHLSTLSEIECINVSAGYFIKCGLNNNYETDNFNEILQELFNKLKAGNESEIPLKEIALLVLQNPNKFINHLMDESEKNLEHLKNIIYICKFLKPICNVPENGENTILFYCIIKKLKELELGDSKKENCIIQLIVELVNCELLNHTIFDQLLVMFNENITCNNYKRATFICKLCKENSLLINENTIIPVIKKFNLAITTVRWNFLTYSQEKCSLIVEIIKLIYHLKNNLPSELNDEYNQAVESFGKKIDSFHLNRNESINFLIYVIPDYDKCADYNEKVCHLLKLLPCCIPLEWDLTANYLTKNNNITTVLQIYVDLLLVLSEMSKNSSDNHSTLSYCFQQFCVITKEIIYPVIKQNRDNVLEQAFIKNICRLIKHLPNELYNIEISLINLFNFDALNTLTQDEDFLLTLVSMSELDICKIICSKITE